MCELDESLALFMIFLKVSKSFDTINYTIILSKLQYYGLGNVIPEFKRA